MSKITKIAKFIMIMIFIFSSLQTSVFSIGTSDEKTVKIGRITSTSAEIPNSKAISTIAIAEINKYMVDFNQPYRFEAIVLDANGTTAQQLEKLQELHSQKIRFVLGGNLDSMAESALSFANDNDMILLSTGSKSDDLAIKGDNLFRLRAPEINIGKNIARMLWSYGVKYACILQSANIREENINSDFDSEWRSLGGSYTGEKIKYPLNTALFNPYLDEAEKQLTAASMEYTVSKVGLVILTGDEINNILNQVSTRPYLTSVTWFSADNMAKNENLLKNKNEYTSLLHIYSPLETLEPTTQFDNLATKFTQITGKTMSDEQALEYDCYWIVALSVVKGGSTDNELKSNLSSVAANYFGAGGRFTLDLAGDLAKPLYKIWGYRKINNILTAYQEGWIDSDSKVYWNSREKPNIKIECSTEPLEVAGGKSLNITGTTEPLKTKTEVSITLWNPEGVESTQVVKTDETGKFILSYASLKPGIWHIQAFWGGDLENRVSTSSIGFFTVYRTITTLSLDATPIILLKDDTIKINGSITPPISNIIIQINLKDPNGIESKRPVKSDSKGVFVDSIPMNKAGQWMIDASFTGDNLYLPSNSDKENVTVERKISRLNILLSESSVIEGSDVSIYGQLNPELQSKQVKIIATSSDGSITNQTANTASDGRYSIIFKPLKIGIWSFKAYFPMDDTYLSSLSESVPLTVTRLPPTADLKIYVKDSQLKPLAGVTVTSTSQPTGQPTVSGVTGSDGFLSLNRVKPGAYSFFATNNSYQSKTASIDAREAQTSEITIILTKNESQTPNQGIPGYSMEIIFSGIVLSVLISILLNRKKHPQPHLNIRVP